MRRSYLPWFVALGAVVVAFVTTVIILNSTVYSPAGFVRSYLDALDRRDSVSALELAGTKVVGEASKELLEPAAMAGVDDVELISSVEGEDGIHTVTYSYSADGVPGESSFNVRSNGAAFGLFPQWEFSTTPLGVIQFGVIGGNSVTVGGRDIIMSNPEVRDPLVVFTPGTYRFTHDSTFLTADELVVTATEPGENIDAAIILRANDHMIETVQTTVDAMLTECTTQTVLQPTGCPFGRPVVNRIVGDPAWSIAQFPAVELRPGETPASWWMPATKAVAHISVDIRSIFDGTISTLDEDVPFEASYIVTFLPGEQLAVTPQY